MRPSANEEPSYASLTSGAFHGPNIVHECANAIHTGRVDGRCRVRRSSQTHPCRHSSRLSSEPTMTSVQPLGYGSERTCSREESGCGGATASVFPPPLSRSVDLPQQRRRCPVRCRLFCEMTSRRAQARRSRAGKAPRKPPVRSRAVGRLGPSSLMLMISIDDPESHANNDTAIDTTPTLLSTIQHYSARLDEWKS